MHIILFLILKGQLLNDDLLTHSLSTLPKSPLCARHNIINKIDWFPNFKVAKEFIF